MQNSSAPPRRCALVEHVWNTNFCRHVCVYHLTGKHPNRQNSCATPRRRAWTEHVLNPMDICLYAVCCNCIIQTGRTAAHRRYCLMSRRRQPPPKLPLPHHREHQPDCDGLRAGDGGRECHESQGQGGVMVGASRRSAIDATPSTPPARS